MKMLVLFLALALTACTSKPQPAVTPAPAPQARVLNVYSWSNYISSENDKKFEEKTNAKVVFSYFSSNEELLAKLQAGAKGYDLIVPSMYLINALKALNLIEPLGKLDWPELQKISARFKGPDYDPNHEYTVPFSWGTTGIAVNRNRVKAKIDSWSWIFDHPEFKGQVTMLDDAPSVVGAALKYLGYSYNEESPAALEKAKALLIKQKKWLKAYTAESQTVLGSGEFAVAQAYSGDVMQVRSREKANIEFVFPKEGGEIFVDALAIPKGAASPDLAKEFMRFTLESQSAVTQVKHLFFSPVVDLKGIAGIEDLSNNAAIFPSDEQLKKFEIMHDNPKRIEAIQRMWTELKSD